MTAREMNQSGGSDSRMSGLLGICDGEPEASRIENAVCRLAINSPGFGQYIVSGQLKKLGIAISPAAVRTIWMRHGLETFEKRFAALMRELSSGTHNNAYEKEMA
jgi:hypothetical protein